MRWLVLSEHESIRPRFTVFRASRRPQFLSTISTNRQNALARRIGSSPTAEQAWAPTRMQTHLALDVATFGDGAVGNSIPRGASSDSN
jgi:hypothetical protein